VATLGESAVLFGGTDGEVKSDETWTGDGTSWARRDVKGPSARTGHAMVTVGDMPPRR
jgi:hypothetical protein